MRSLTPLQFRNIFDMPLPDHHRVPAHRPVVVQGDRRQSIFRDELERIKIVAKNARSADVDFGVCHVCRISGGDRAWRRTRPLHCQHEESGSTAILRSGNGVFVRIQSRSGDPIISESRRARSQSRHGLVGSGPRTRSEHQHGRRSRSRKAGLRRRANCANEASFAERARHDHSSRQTLLE